MSKQSFADLGVSNALVRALSKRGIKSPFPIQELVIGDVLAGNDVLAKSPTGSGKTLAFGAGLIERMTPGKPAPKALVLAPTRELVRQIHEELTPLAEAKSLRIATVYGGVGIQAQARRAARAHMIVATPGRLEDLLKRGAFSLKHVEMLVLDEADRMLDMGFRPPVDRIVDLCSEKRQTLFFSATLDGECGVIARQYTHKPTRHEHKPETDANAKIEHRFIAVEHETRLESLASELDCDRDLALVFVRTKRGADSLAKRLKNKGIRTGVLHGDKSQNYREKTLATFQAGRIDTLIATDVVARGIDIDGITHVINFDPPEDRESYVHRIGRTGRAGRTGVGITFVRSEHKGMIRKIATTLKLEREFEQSHPSRKPKRKREQSETQAGDVTTSHTQSEQSHPHKNSHKRKHSRTRKSDPITSHAQSEQSHSPKPKHKRKRKPSHTQTGGATTGRDQFEQSRPRKPKRKPSHTQTGDATTSRNQFEQSRPSKPRRKRNKYSHSQKAA